MIYVKQQSQFLPLSADTAWNYFSRPENLNEITPPDLDFKVRSSLPDRIYPGLMIVYSIGIFKGITTEWVTEITQVQPPFYFIDEQRFGPYAMWHHEHHFREVTGGVEMTDIVHYKLPFGKLGSLFHGILVQPRLTEIFDYRRHILNQKFGGKPDRKASA